MPLCFGFKRHTEEKMNVRDCVDWFAVAVCAMIGIPSYIIITGLIVNGLVFITKILTDSKKSSCKEEESEVKE